jgi:hypothetical protein
MADSLAYELRATLTTLATLATLATITSFRYRGNKIAATYVLSSVNGRPGFVSRQ